MSSPTADPDLVEVLDHGLRREVGQQAGVAPRARVRIVMCLGDQRIELVGVVGRRIEIGQAVEVVDAADRAARVHAARIEPDEIEALEDGLREQGHAVRTNSSPDPPGPPGLMISEPIRFVRSVAGSR